MLVQRFFGFPLLMNFMNSAEVGYKECIQRMQYYPSGLPWAESAGASGQPWKYNGKEFVRIGYL